MRIAESRKFFAIAALSVVLIAGSLMQASVFRIAGVAPNLLLVCLIVASFFTDNVAFFGLLVIISTWSIRSLPSFIDPVAITTGFLALLVFWLQRRIVVKGLTGVCLLTGLTTVMLYAVIDPVFIWQQPGILAGELFYNIVLGALLFELGDRFFGREVR